MSITNFTFDFFLIKSCANFDMSSVLNTRIEKVMVDPIHVSYGDDTVLGACLLDLCPLQYSNYVT